MIIDRAFSVHPEPLLVREFFAFLREIFYYNQDMDQVDIDLACDTLEILNNLLKNRSQIQDQQQQSKNAMKRSVISTGRNLDKYVDYSFTPMDYFYFSEQTPGLANNDGFTITSDCFTISFMFKLDLNQIKKQRDPDMTLIHIKPKALVPMNANYPIV